MDIKLRNLVNEDKEYFFCWIKDKEVTKYSLSAFQSMANNNEISNWFDGLLVDKSSFNKAIYDATKNKIIGYAGFCKIDKINQSAEYFIFIGDKSYHGKGIGTYITKEIIKIGFDRLNLNRIMLTVFENNNAAINAYTNAGFKMEGLLRESSYRNKMFHNKVIMSVLKSEYCN